MSVDERTAAMGLCALQSFGSPKVAELVAEHGASEVWSHLVAGGNTRWHRLAATIDLDQLVAATKACDARFLVPDDAEWPTQLADLEFAKVGSQGGIPFGLWARGALDLTGLEGAVAIVGSRASSHYGESIAAEFAAGVGYDGRIVISGMAYGIDAASHKGALAARCPTIALLACGVDLSYPVAHTRLLEQVRISGAVISEVPPGARPQKAGFLARNRLIAALSDAVVVVEASTRSGARNTATWALAMNRVLAAVPGPVTSAMSQTPHRLIRDGAATLVGTAGELLELLGPLQVDQAELVVGDQKPIDRLPEPLRAIREAMQVNELVSAESIALRTGLTIFECLAAVQELTEGGWLVEGPAQRWSLPSNHRQPAQG